MTVGKLKSLGVNPRGRFADTIPYNPDALKALVATGKLV